MDGGTRRKGQGTTGSRLACLEPLEVQFFFFSFYILFYYTNHSSNVSYRSIDSAYEL